MRIQLFQDREGSMAKETKPSNWYEYHADEHIKCIRVDNEIVWQTPRCKVRYHPERTDLLFLTEFDTDNGKFDLYKHIIYLGSEREEEKQGYKVVRLYPASYREE